MAGEERDARLILRAEDRASRTFDQVAASVKKVRQEIAEQAEAARKGNGDLNAMQRQLESLKQAGDDLVQGQSLIRQFDGLEESVGRAEQRLKSATASLEAYRAKVGDNPTDNQAATLDKRMASVDRAQANLDRMNQRLQEVSQRMERAGIATDDTDKEFMRIAASAQETAQAIAAVKNQIDEYPAAIERAKAELAEFNAAQALAGKDTSFLKPDDFAFVQSLDSAKAKLDAVTAAERQHNTETAQWLQQMSDRWRLQLRSLAEQDKAMKAAAATAEKASADEARRASDLAAFREIGRTAAEDAVKVERYGASVQALGNDFQSFAATVRTAVGGTTSSLQDIGQAIAQIDASSELLNKPKARINELQESSGKLAIAIATLDRTARNIDGFRQQQLAVQAAEASFAEAQQEVLRLARAVGEAEAPSEQLATELERAQRALARAGQEMQKTRNDAIKMGDALKAAGVDTDRLDDEMARFTVSAGKAGNASGALQSKLRGRNGFLGLNPFELQNLGYQINDIFVSLASGQKPLTVLVQQGAQIGQLFTGFFTTLLRFFPLIAGLTVLLSPLIGAFVQAGRAASAAADANAILAGSADGVRQAAGAYAEAGVQLRNLGVDGKDAKAALEDFHKAGLDPSALNSYVQALGDAASGGADVTDTAKLLTEALSGGTKEVEALNDKFNLLTPAEETQIEKMIESGNESEARRILFEKFEQTAQRMSDQANGPWSKAWNNLTLAFDNFTRAISDSAPFRTLGRYMDYIRDKIAGAMDDIAYFLNYASKRGVGGAISDAIFGPQGGAVGQAQQEAAQFANRRGRAKDTPFPAAAQRDTLEGERTIRKLTEAQEDQRKSLKKLSREQTAAAARQKALAEGVGSPAQRKRQADIAEATALAKYDSDAAKKAAADAKKRDAAAKRSAKAAETLANQRRAIEEQLARDLDGIDKKVAEGQTASIEDRRQAVLDTYTGLFQKLDEAKRKGVTRVGDQSLAQYEATVRAQIAILQNNAEIKAREEQITETIKDRGDKIKDIQDQLARGDITPDEAVKAFAETISATAPKIAQMTTDAINFAKSLRGAVPDPKLEATISRLERLQQQNAPGQGNVLLRTLDQGVVKGEGDKLDQMLAERNALVAAENTLVELGVKTRRDAQDQIEAAYERTNPLIQAQIDKIRELLSAFKDDPAMQTFYDTWMAKLKGVEAQSTYVDARFTQLKSGFDNVISQNAIAGIDKIAGSFAALAARQKNVIDVLGDVGLAFAGFIAQTLIGIGKLIIQMLVLDAVQRITGIPVGGVLRLMGVAAGGHHTGGLAGTSDRTFTRQVPSIAFANAPRYHGGGIAGFAPDEVPAVLRRNEEILDETDPRHRFNLGTGSAPAAPPPAIRQALVLDPSELANAMAGDAGEKMVITHLRRNKTTIKQLLD